MSSLLKLSSILSLLVLNSAWAGITGIRPQVEDDPNLYSLYMIDDSVVDFKSNKVTVKGPTLMPEQRVEENFNYGKMRSFKINRNDYFLQKMMAEGIFEAQTGSGTSVGTAFLVGENLVLTNEHVAATDNQKRQCRKFGIYLPGQEFVSCQKVHYCNHDLDFCLVEMSTLKDGKNLSSKARVLSLDPKAKYSKDKEVYLVGNANGRGIQGSKGRGFTKDESNGDKITHYAPSLGGTSGSPLFDSYGRVMAINHSSASEVIMVKDKSGKMTPYKNWSQIGKDSQLVRYQLERVSKYAENYGTSAAAMLKNLKKNIPAAVYNKISQSKYISNDQRTAFIDELEEQQYLVENYLNDIPLEETLLNCAQNNKAALNGRVSLGANVYTISSVNIPSNNTCLNFIDDLSDANDKTKQKLKIKLSKKLNGIYNTLNQTIDDGAWKKAMKECLEQDKSFKEECVYKHIIDNKLKKKELNFTEDQLAEIVQIYRDVKVLEKAMLYKYNFKDIIVSLIEKEMNAEFAFNVLMGLDGIEYYTDSIIFYDDSSNIAGCNSFKTQLQKIVDSLGLDPADDGEVWKEVDHHYSYSTADGEWKKQLDSFSKNVARPYSEQKKKVFSKKKNIALLKKLVKEWEYAETLNEQQIQKLVEHFFKRIK